MYLPCVEKKTSPASLRHFALGFSKENVFIHFLENSLSFVMCTYRKLVRRSRSSRRRRVCGKRLFYYIPTFLFVIRAINNIPPEQYLYFVNFLNYSLSSLIRSFCCWLRLYNIEMAFGKM